MKVVMEHTIDLDEQETRRLLESSEATFTVQPEDEARTIRPGDLIRVVLHDREVKRMTQRG